MDEVVEAIEKYHGLVPLVYDIETMGLDEARPEDMQTAVYLKREADKVIAKHKYKRCLAMVKWCKMSAIENDTRMCLPEKQKFTKHEEYLYFIGYYHKWHRCWLELAEKFKEAK